MLATSSAAALLALTAAPAGATGFLVTTGGDAGDGTCDATCTLRDAVEDANAAGGADVVTFDPSITGTITLTNFIGISDDLTITGPGADVLAVSGNDTFQIFNTAGAIDLSISGLTLTAGNTSGEGGAVGVTGSGSNLTLTDLVVSESYADGDGGGVRFSGDTLIVTNSTFTHNEAGDDGGGLYSSAETATITGSTFNGDNHAGNDGGGFEVYGGYSHTMISNTIVTGNSSEESGGGAQFYSDNSGPVYATVENSTFAGNTTNYGGGGFYADDFNGVVRNTTVSGNHQTNDTFGGGGGISLNGDDTNIQIVNSTISGNTAREGGGLYMYASTAGAVQLLQSTVANNTALYTGGGIYIDDDSDPQALQIIGTIVAANTSESGSGAAASDIATTGTSQRSAQSGKPPKTPDASNPERAGQDEHAGAADVGALATGLQLTSSLVQGSIDPNLTVTDGGGNLLGVDAALAALANNGGPTQTLALNAGSPAINTGPNPVPDFPGNEFDQRGPGYPRVSAGRADIGAFEVQAIELVPRFTG